MCSRTYINHEKCTPFLGNLVKKTYTRKIFHFPATGPAIDLEFVIVFIITYINRLQYVPNRKDIFFRKRAELRGRYFKIEFQILMLHLKGRCHL